MTHRSFVICFLNEDIVTACRFAHHALYTIIFVHCNMNLSQKQSKCPWRCYETVQNVLLIPPILADSAFSPLRAPGGGISQSSTCAMNPNLILR
jgi:hypothetical protein